MIGKFSEALTDALIKGNQIDKGDRALYVYGLFVLFSNLLFLTVTCVTGLLLQIGIQSVCFYIAFMSLRRFAGGYHAKTELRCQLLSTLSVVASVFFIRTLQNATAQIPLAVAVAVGSILIFCFAPTDTPQKPLSPEEQKHFRKITIGILLGLDVVFALAAFLNWQMLFLPIGAAVSLESILLTLGKAQRVFTAKKTDS